MARPRKPATARKPLAPKNTNIVSPQRSPPPPPPSTQLSEEVKQRMSDAKHREVERRITAIRAIREAEAEGYRTSLRTALSMLSEEVRVMPLSEFVKRFCPDREYVKDPDSGIVKLIPKLVSENPNFLVPSTLKGGELSRGSQRGSMVQPTPRSFPMGASSVREDLMHAADRLVKDELEDEEFLKYVQSFKSSRPSSNLTTPRNVNLTLGMTPKTVRLPKKGEALLSVNGSPLGVFNKDEIVAIPEQRPSRRRRLRTSVTSTVY